MNRHNLILSQPLLLCLALSTGCTQQSATVTGFAADVAPIINENCLECHQPGGPGHEKSGLSVTSYANLMKGTRFGPVIKPGDSLSSTLVILIEGRADKSINMPHGDRKPLTKAQVQTVKNWINEGAKNN